MFSRMKADAPASLETCADSWFSVAISAAFVPMRAESEASEASTVE